jgi:citrate synthase
MLAEIGSLANVPAFVKEVKEGKGEKKLMGFGHRVYKNYDPRAKVIKRLAEQVFEVTGRNPLLDIARRAGADRAAGRLLREAQAVPERRLLLGLIYQAMGFPVDMFPVLFAIPRTSGWLAQWCEMLDDSEQKIARPRQIYTGKDRRDYPEGRANPFEYERKRS